MKTKSLILILLLALGGTVFADRFAAEPKEVVRYIDVQTVIEGWSALQQQSQLITEAASQEQEALKADYANFVAAKADLDLLDPASDEYMETAFGLSLVEKALEERIKFTQAKFNQRTTELLEAGVRRIHQACGELGEREGFSAILMAPPALPAPEVNLSDAVLDLQGRWVIWSNNTFNVSTQVIQILNNSEL
jgi:Skp family chaperone for outer membrane proteins